MSKLMALGERAFQVRVGLGDGVLSAKKVMVGTGTSAVVAWQQIVAGNGSLGRVNVPENAWTDLHTHTVVGTGPATFSGVYSWGTDVLQFLSFTRSVRLLVNGTQVAFQTGSFTTNGWNVTLTSGPYVKFYEGDVLKVQAYTTGTGRTSARNVDSSSFSLVLA